MPPPRSRGVFFLLFALGTACASPPSPPPPEVEYAGCAAVLVPGPVCVLGPERELRLWVGAPPDAKIEIQADGRRIDAAGKAVQEGQQFSLPRLPPGAKTIAALVGGRAPWSLSLTDGAEMERLLASQARQGASRNVLGEVDEKTLLVYGYIRDRNLAAARKTLADLQLPLEAPAESRYLAGYYRGLLAEKEGDYRSALAEIQEAVEIAERVKLDRERWLAEEKLALLLRGVGRSRDAAQLFERLRQTSHSADSCEDAQLLNNQAWATLLAREAGESFGDPTHLLEKALETYATCDRVTPEKKANILLNLALAHLQEGRLAQAKGLLAQARKLQPHPPLFQMLWRLDLEARIALREGRPAEALRRFEDLQELGLLTSSPDGRLRAAFGRARAQEALGDRSVALETLREAEALLDEQSLQIPLHEGRETFMATRQAVVSLHVELLLEQARTADALAVARHARSRMLRQLERTDRLVSLTPEQRARWDRLLTDYQERRKVLENRAKEDWKLPADRLRHEQVARKAEAEAVNRLLDRAFLVLGNPGEGTAAAPPSPRPGELILAYHPLSDGWVGFAADSKTVMAHRFKLSPEVLSRPEELASRLLLPFRASIAKAERIRLLPTGTLESVDFHALPFDGDALLARGPVVYGLDLPPAVALAQASGRRALLVADPREDLPGALAEARTVRAVLKSRSRPWITEELKNREASATAVRSGLAAADLLHYAGHGTFSGFGGWESGLLLAEETQLTLGDLLALDRVPTWVVLSACDTGRTSTETPVESLGLARAFLLAGSRAVVASTRPADDRALPRFFTELYRQWDREPDLAVALQRTQLSWRKRDPAADWDGFRLFEP